MTTLIHKGPLKRNRPKQSHIHTVPTYDEANANGTNKGRDRFLANKPRIFSWGTERMPHRIQSYNRVTIHWSAHPQGEQDVTEKFIPIVNGALGIVPEGLIKGLEDLEIRGRVEAIQTTTLLRTARILRRVWKIEETRNHSNFNERLSVTLIWKTLKE